jgi:hypothetical protein
VSYLEELLPEFRKGAKIRISTWPKNQYIYREGNEIYNEDGNKSKFLDNYVLSCDLWEFYQEPIDWQYIIDHKCLCWFWDGHFTSACIGVLREYDKKYELGFVWTDESGNSSQYRNCRPVRRDEVNFYEVKND